MLRPVRPRPPYCETVVRNPATAFCTICPTIALGRPDRGGNKKNVGKKCPSGTAQVL